MAIDHRESKKARKETEPLAKPGATRSTFSFFIDDDSGAARGHTSIGPMCLPANYTFRLLAPNERRTYYRCTLTLHRLRVNLPARARRVQSDDSAKSRCKKEKMG